MEFIRSLSTTTKVGIGFILLLVVLMFGGSITSKPSTASSVATPTTVAQPTPARATEAAPTTAPVTQAAPTTAPATSEPFVSNFDASVAVEEANVRSGPGTSFPLVGKVQFETGLDLVGRNSDSTWFKFNTSSIKGGWINSELVAISINTEELPVMEISAETQTSIPATGQPAPTTIPAATQVFPNDSGFSVRPGTASGGTQDGYRGELQLSMKTTGFNVSSFSGLEVRLSWPGGGSEWKRVNAGGFVGFSSLSTGDAYRLCFRGNFQGNDPKGACLERIPANGGEVRDLSITFTR